MDFFIEMRTKGESKFNHELNWSDILFISTTSSEITSYDLRALQLKRSPLISNCDITNSKQPFDCINKFLASNTPCEIPWLKRYAPAGLEKCETSEQTKQYFDMAFNVSIGVSNETELKNFGCLVKNCIENTWRAEKLITRKQPPNISLFGMFGILSNQVSKKINLTISFVEMPNMKYS